ncbi:hypothetical protein, partial [Cellulomonas massiliensis]|uniref:hypothetical protein n=1 Tax=Cellulomonas massiliensis TaxID=1465811 RepID=UPI001C54D9F5
MSARGLVAAVLVALAALLGVAPPAAADGGVEVSPDGRTWSTRLDGSLLVGADAMVPGDVATGDLWVRNGSDVEARVRVLVRAGVGDGGPSLAGSLHVVVDGDDVPGGGTWRGPVLAPGDAIRIPLVVRFDAGASAAAVQVAQVLDRVTLVEAASEPEQEADPDDDYAFTGGDEDGAGPAGPGGPEDGGLARTGADVVPLGA